MGFIRVPVKEKFGVGGNFKLRGLKLFLKEIKLFSTGIFSIYFLLCCV